MRLTHNIIIPVSNMTYTAGKMFDISAGAGIELNAFYVRDNILAGDNIINISIKLTFLNF